MRIFKRRHYKIAFCYRVGLHAEYTNSEKSIRALADFAKAKKLPTYTHLCETKKEVEGCLQRRGKTPAVYLAEQGLSIMIKSAALPISIESMLSSPIAAAPLQDSCRISCRARLI